MAGGRTVEVLHRGLLVLAALAVLGYGARLVALGADPLDGEALPLAAAFVALAVLGGVRAWRAGRRPEDLLLAGGLGLSAAGWTYWAVLLVPMADPPYPSPADGLWMSLHLTAVVALAWHVGTTWRARTAFTLDALIGAAGVTAAVAGFLVPALVADGAALATVGVNAVYLGANAAHLLLLLSVLAIHSFSHRGLLWARLAGVGVLTATNAGFLVDVADTGVVPLGTVMNLGWLGGFALLVLSVGAHRDPDLRPPTQWSVLVVPAVGTGLALAVLVGAGTGLPAARWLAAAAVLLALGRLGFALVEAAALAGSHEMALTDELTGLANRRGFYDAMRELLADDGTATVALLDLNRFKDVNDTLGHRAGDVLLALVGRRLQEVVRAAGRPGDVVARVGGDEFALLLPRATRADGIAAAWRFATALDDTYDVEGLAVRASAAAGVVHVPAHGTDIDELLRRADVAMYAAKAVHEAVVVYSADLDTRSREDLARVERMRAALLGDGLVLHYQPKVDLRTGAVVGVEALARLREGPDLLLPGQFLPALTQGGLLATLTGQVVDTAVRQAAEWHAAGMSVSVAVNVPADVLLGGAVADQVASVLHRYHLPGELLYLEVTEEVLLADRVAGRAAIEAVRALGTRVSIDDYGTGYSSLAYLRDLPLDEIKLDRSFVRGMADDPRATRIVESTIALAHGLDLQVVAEGVEEDGDREAVLAAGCDIGQGYLFARPVPPEQIPPLVGTPPAAGTIPSPRPFDRAPAGKETP